MKTPNYHDFYQKALIPIGFNDLIALKEFKSYEFDSSSTHWLIAVEGEQLSQPNIYSIGKSVYTRPIAMVILIGRNPSIVLQ